MREITSPAIGERSSFRLVMAPMPDEDRISLIGTFYARVHDEEEAASYCSALAESLRDFAADLEQENAERNKRLAEMLNG